MSPGFHLSILWQPQATCPAGEHVHIVVLPTVHLSGHQHPTHERRLLLHSPGHQVQEAAVVVWDDAGPCAGWEER